MPSLSTASKILALFCSDLHISLTPPLARSAEPSWIEAQERQLQELISLQEKYSCPIIIPGDVFDRWNVPIEAVNLALRTLKQVFAVPGNHDLVNHRLEDIQKTPFWTLVEAGRVKYLAPGEKVEVGLGTPLLLHGFPHGCHPHVPSRSHDLCLEIAVVHRYLWKEGKCHPGATEEFHVSKMENCLRGYDYAVFGDNHQGFAYDLENGCKIWNCGGFFRRRSDERDYRPSIGILRGDGSITRHKMDVSRDLFLEEEEIVQSILKLDAEGLVDELRNLGDKALDFEEAIRRVIRDKKVSPEISTEILNAMRSKK